MDWQRLKRPATRADGQPAWRDAPPRLRQSEIDARRAWACAEVRELRV